MTAGATLAADLYLRNGIAVTVRPVTAKNEAEIFEFWNGLAKVPGVCGSSVLQGPPPRGSPRSSRR
jgi:hypothetical protein